MSETRVISYKIEVDDAPVKSLKQQLREATLEAQRLATAEIIDEKALQAAIQKTAELKDQMMDVNEQVTELAAGSPFEKMKNSIGGVQGALMNLDFDKAATSAKALTNTITNLNPAAMASQFAAFGGVVMQLGRAVGMLTVKFVQMGIALLANPIFLLVAAIVAIVAAVVVFLHKIGVLQKILDVLMAPINMLIDGFYALTDAIGLTSKAAEEEAEKIKTAYEDSAKAIDERGKILEAQVGNELELLKARSTGTEEDLEKIRKKEEQLLFVKQKGAQDSLTLAQSTLNQMKNNSEITEEELEKQRLLVLDLQLAYDKAKTASLSYFAQRIADASKAKTAADEKAAEEDKKNSEEAAANAKRAREESRKRAEEEAKLLIERKRFLKDIELNAIADDRQRELAISQEKIKREQEDLMSTVNWMRYSKEQQEQITKDFQNREKQLIVDFNTQTDAIQKAKDDADKLKREEHLNKMNDLKKEYAELSLSEGDFAGAEALIKEQYEAELLELQKQFEDKLILEEEFLLRKNILKKNYDDEVDANNEARLAKEKENADKIIAAEQELQAAKAGALNAGIGLLSSIFSKNEAIQKALFLVEKGKAAADVIVNGLKTSAALTAQIAVGTGLLGNPVTAAVGASQIAAAKMGLATNKIGMGISLAAIAAASIDKFKNGGSSPSPGVIGGGGGGGGGGSTPAMGQAQNTPQINMFQNNQNNQPMSGVNRVSVVDYTDIQNTGNRVAMLQNAVSLG